MNVPQNRKHTSIVLTQETVHFGGMILDYRLVACPSQTERFRICVTSGNETVESALGCDIETALRIYRAILGGRVTLCGLEDVLCDLQSV